MSGMEEEGELEKLPGTVMEGVKEVVVQVLPSRLQNTEVVFV